tara:strand:+ start:8528 stop:9034 length:507 start_codon:yes stop_codon:yes gene_type:complete
MTKSKTWQTLHSSANQCWRTPRALFDKLHEEFGFTVDVAALDDSALLPAWYGPDHSDEDRRDGLAVPWAGVVWCNPPYGKAAPAWIAKAAAEAKRGVTVVMLVMANTDTRYFHDHAFQAEEIRFIKGRVKFARQDGTPAASAPKGSALLIFTPKGNDGIAPLMRAYDQ